MKLRLLEFRRGKGGFVVHAYDDKHNLYHTLCVQMELNEPLVIQVCDVGFESKGKLFLALAKLHWEHLTGTERNALELNIEILQHGAGGSHRRE